MTHLLAQAIVLPGVKGGSEPVAYPSEFKGFLFQGPNGTIGAILSNAMPFILGIAGLALLVMLIFAGYGFMTAAGDAKKMEKAKQQLTWAIVGFLIVFGSYWLIQIVSLMFGSGVTQGFH